LIHLRKCAIVNLEICADAKQRIRKLIDHEKF
jgi:hypothetical protein